MRWGGLSRTFLLLAFLIFIICSATLLVLGLQYYNKSISSYGTVTIASTKTFAVWLGSSWTFIAKTPQEFTTLFDTCSRHGINMIMPYGGGIRTDGSVVLPYYPFDITNALKDYNKAHGTNIKASVWFGVRLDWSNPPNLRDPRIQNTVLNVVGGFCKEGSISGKSGVPYDGVNMDWEWYANRWDEVVIMSNLVADTFPDIIVSTDTPQSHHALLNKQFSKNVDFVIPMLYGTGREGDSYANWFTEEAKTQLINTDKPVLLGVPSVSIKPGENIQYALQGLQNLLATGDYPYLHGLALYDYEHMEAGLWDYWDRAVALLKNY